MSNYKGEITQENCQDHHLVDHEIDDVNIASIKVTVYEKHIYKSTVNAYCAHIYNIPSDLDSKFAPAIIQRAEISKIMGLIGSVTKSDTPCKLFSNPIIGQLEELEGYIFNILGPEAVAQFKDNISDVQANRGKGVNKNQLSNIWVVSEELASKNIDRNSQLCKHHADNRLYQQLSTNDIMLQYSRINSVFFTDTLLAQTNQST